MTLKTTALIAAVLQVAASLLSLAQYIKACLNEGVVLDTLTHVSWPLGILGGISVAVFLFNLVLKQKNTGAKND